MWTVTVGLVSQKDLIFELQLRECTAILETSHGRRSIDVLGILCPERANWDCKYCFPSIS